MPKTFYDIDTSPYMEGSSLIGNAQLSANVMGQCYKDFYTFGRRLDQRKITLLLY
jgi:hypothetical protein